MTVPCDRKRCSGSMEAWATERRADGTVWSWLVCDRDTRHTVERDDGPTPDGQQDALPGLGDGR